jgi:hypothetical protein
MPSTATSEDDQRSGMFRMFIAVTAPICSIAFAIL